MAAATAELLPPIGAEPLAPVPMQILVNENDVAWIPHAFADGWLTAQRVTRGIGLAWTPAPEVDGVLLMIAGGNPDQPTDENVTAFISRKGLRQIIADLQSIDAQLAVSA